MVSPRKMCAVVEKRPVVPLADLLHEKTGKDINPTVAGAVPVKNLALAAGPRKERQTCPKRFEIAIEVWTFVLRWKGAMCARVQSENEKTRDRRTEKKTERRAQRQTGSQTKNMKETAEETTEGTTQQVTEVMMEDAAVKTTAMVEKVEVRQVSKQWIKRIVRVAASTVCRPIPTSKAHTHICVHALGPRAMYIVQ